ncbi:hypothetical protein V8F20_009573 [Naviculisporaceae sp. PSN 640]
MPLPYKPAADSRHRRACFALYRALVRQGLQIPLPNDILYETKNNPIPKQFAPRSSSYLVGGRKDGNPIPNLVINAFRRNKKLTSPRLICLALKNGYKFLDLFAQAKTQAPPRLPVAVSNSSGVLRNVFDQTTGREVAPDPPAEPEPLDPSRPIYNQIITFLRENQARVNHFLLKREAEKKPNPFRPHPDHQPLLTLLPPPEDDPNAKPVYVPTARPLPLSQLSGGVRKLPTLDHCSGYPFLRLSKPQSPVLSVMVWNNSRRRQLRVYRYQEMRDEDLPLAQMEDDWEEVVEGMHQVMEATTEENEPDWEAFIAKMEEKRQEKLMEKANEAKKRRSQSQSQQEPGDWVILPEASGRTDWANKPELTYADSWQICIEELGARLVRQNDHWVARGRALWELVKAERELAEKEAKERGRGVQRTVSPRYREKIEGWRGAWEKKQRKNRENKAKEAEERGDVEAAEKLREKTFRVTAPRRMGFSKRAMRNAIS